MPEAREFVRTSEIGGLDYISEDAPKPQIDPEDLKAMAGQKVKSKNVWQILTLRSRTKGLELKFRTIILTYLLSFRKSILLLFLVYLNLKKDSEAFQKAQSVTKQHRFNVKSQLKDRKNAEKNNGFTTK